MAADSLQRTYDYNDHVPAVKLRIVGDTIYAITGYYSWFDAWIEWHKNGADPKSCPTSKDAKESGNFFAFEASGRCFMFDEILPYPDEQFAPIAFGSGRKYAIGAFALGSVINRPVSAHEAVAAAITRDPGSGGPIQVIDLQNLAKTETIADRLYCPGADEIDLPLPSSEGDSHALRQYRAHLAKCLKP